MGDSIFDEILGQSKKPKKMTKRQAMQNIGGTLNLISQTPKLPQGTGGVLDVLPQAMGSKGVLGYSEIPAPVPTPTPQPRPLPSINIPQALNPFPIIKTGNKFLSDKEREKKTQEYSVYSSIAQDNQLEMARTRAKVARQGYAMDEDNDKMKHLYNQQIKVGKQLSKIGADVFTPDLMDINEYGKETVKHPLKAFVKTATDTLKDPSKDFKDQYIKNITEEGKFLLDTSEKPIQNPSLEYGEEATKGIKNPILKHIAQTGITAGMLAVENLPENIAWSLAGAKMGESFKQGQPKPKPPSPKEPPRFDVPESKGTTFVKDPQGHYVYPSKASDTQILPKIKPSDISQTKIMKQEPKLDDTAIFKEPIRPSSEVKPLPEIKPTNENINKALNEMDDITKTFVGKPITKTKTKLINKIDKNVNKYPESKAIPAEEKAFTTDVIVKEIDNVDDAVKMVNPKADVAKTVIGKEARANWKKLQNALKELRINPETNIDIKSMAKVDPIINPSVGVDNLVSKLPQNPSLMSIALKELNKVDPVGVFAMIRTMVGEPVNFKQVYTELEKAKIDISKPILKDIEIDSVVQSIMPQTINVPKTEEQALSPEPSVEMPLPSTEIAVKPEEPTILPEPSITEPPQTMPSPEVPATIPQEPLVLPELQEEEAVMPTVETITEEPAIESKPQAVVVEEKNPQQELWQLLKEAQEEVAFLIANKKAKEKEALLLQKPLQTKEEIVSMPQTEEKPLIIKPTREQSFLKKRMEGLTAEEKTNPFITGRQKGESSYNFNSKIIDMQIPKTEKITWEEPYIDDISKDKIYRAEEFEGDGYIDNYTANLKDFDKIRWSVKIFKNPKEKGKAVLVIEDYFGENTLEYDFPNVKTAKQEAVKVLNQIKDDIRKREIEKSEESPIIEAIKKERPYLFKEAKEEIKEIKPVEVEEKTKVAEETKPTPKPEPKTEAKPAGKTATKPTEEENLKTVRDIIKKKLQVPKPAKKEIKEVAKSEEVKAVKGKRTRTRMTFTKKEIALNIKDLPKDKALTFVIKDKQLFINDKPITGVSFSTGTKNASFSLDRNFLNNIKAEPNTQLELKVYDEGMPLMLYNKSNGKFIASLTPQGVKMHAGINLVEFVKDKAQSFKTYEYITDKRVAKIFDEMKDELTQGTAYASGMLEEFKEVSKTANLNEKDLVVMADVMREGFEYADVVAKVGETKAPVVWNEAKKMEANFAMFVRNFIQEFEKDPKAFTYYAKYLPNKYAMVELSNADLKETEKLVKGLESKAERNKDEEALLSLGKAILDKDERIRLQNELAEMKSKVKTYTKEEVKELTVKNDELPEEAIDESEIPEDATPIPITEADDIVYVRSKLYGSLKGKYIKAKDYNDIFLKMKFLQLATKKMPKGNVKSGGINETYLMKRKDLPEDYKNFLGFKAGISTYVYRTIADIVRNQAKMRMFNKLVDIGMANEDGNTIIDGEENVLVRENWGSLQNKYIPSSVYKQLSEVQADFKEPTSIDNITMFWKMAKTVMQASTHVRNLLANLSIYGVSRGTGHYNVVPDLIDAFKMLWDTNVNKKTSNELQFYKELGIANSTLIDLVERANPMAEFQHLSDLGEYDMNYPKGILDKIKDGAEWLYSVAEKAYKSEDEIFKIVVAKDLFRELEIDMDYIKNNWNKLDFEERRNIVRLFNEAELPKKIKDIIPSYDRLPKMAKTISTAWWGEPFVAYPFAVVGRTLPALFSKERFNMNLSAFLKPKADRDVDIQSFNDSMKELKKIDTEIEAIKEPLKQANKFISKNKTKYTMINNSIIKNIEKINNHLEQANINLYENKLMFMDRENNLDALTKATHELKDAQFRYIQEVENSSELADAYDAYNEATEELNNHLKDRKENEKAYRTISWLENRLKLNALRVDYLYNTNAKLSSKIIKYKKEGKPIPKSFEPRILRNEEKIEEANKAIDGLMFELGEAELRVSEIEKTINVKSRTKTAEHNIPYIKGKESITKRKWMRKYGTPELRRISERIAKLKGEKKILDKKFIEEYGSKSLRNAKKRIHILQGRKKELDRIYNKNGNFIAGYEANSMIKEELTEKGKNLLADREERLKSIKVAGNPKDVITTEVFNKIFFGKNYTGNRDFKVGGNGGNNNPPPPPDENYNGFFEMKREGKPSWLKYLRLGLWLLAPAIVGFAGRKAGDIGYLEDVRTRSDYQRSNIFNIIERAMNDFNIKLPEVAKGMLLDTLSGFVPIGRDNEGNILYFNMEYILPLYSISRYVEYIANHFDPTSQTDSIIMLNNPIIRTVMDIVYNKSGFTGQPIYVNNYDSDKTAKITSYAIKQFMPSLLFGNGFFKMVDAIVGKKYKGRTQKVSDVLLNELFGFKIYRQNTKEAMEWKRMIGKIQLGELRREQRKLEKQPKLNKEEIKKKEKDIQKLLKDFKIRYKETLD